jgi:hypothetical protein
MWQSVTMICGNSFCAAFSPVSLFAHQKCANRARFVHGRVL